jgi:hypothetical protein
MAQCDGAGIFANGIQVVGAAVTRGAEPLRGLTD